MDGPAQGHQGAPQAIGSGRFRLAGEIGLDGGVQRRRTAPPGQLSGRLDGTQAQGPLNHP